MPNIYKIFIWITTLYLISSLVGCTPGVKIRYTVDKADQIAPSRKPQGRIQVAIIEDRRETLEQYKKARKDCGFKDLGDYTYNKDFSGDLTTALTKYLVDYLQSTKLYESVQISPYKSNQVPSSWLDTLAERNIDALLVGQLNHFYTYYDTKTGREIALGVPLVVTGWWLGYKAGEKKEESRIHEPLFGVDLVIVKETHNPVLTLMGTFAGEILASLLEGSFPRDIETHMQIDLNLISTKTHEIIWKDRVDYYWKGKKAVVMWNQHHGKTTFALASLKIATKQISSKISSISIP
ncbi:MAG: hypothetical protein NTW14_01365 [bacterium]|nr:hypothetical protein [bacterium]